MLELTKGNLLAADVEALINAVNTEGVMGKGIALQFKNTFPEMFEAYKEACERGELQPGQMHVFERSGGTNPRYIINFPTKREWRRPSKLEDVQAGLAALRGEIQARKICSVAVPALGCGNGGLPWPDVFEAIRRELGDLSETRVLIFPPLG